MTLEDRLTEELRHEADVAPPLPPVERVVRAARRRTATLAVGALAVVALGGVGVATLAGGGGDEVPVPDVVDSPPGSAAPASPSPAGDGATRQPPAEGRRHTLAWLRAPDGAGGSRIEVLEPGADEPRRLDVPASARQPAWEPDGRRLAFVDDTGLAVLDRASGEVHRVVDGFVDRPVWSPDGERIVHTGREGRLQVVRPDGTGQRPLAGTAPEQDVDELFATFAPDGDEIAFKRIDREAARAELVVVGLDSGSERAVPLPAGTDPSHLAWSPEGGWIAFVDTGGSGSEPSLFVVRPDGSDLTRLAPAAAGRVAWSPAGDALAYSAPDPDASTDATGDVAVVRLAPEDAAGRRPVASGPRVVADVRGRDHAVAWSPDGGWLAFTAFVPPEGASDTYLVRPDGTGLTAVTDHGTAWGPQWLPEGSTAGP